MVAGKGMAQWIINGLLGCVGLHLTRRSTFAGLLADHDRMKRLLRGEADPALFRDVLRSPIANFTNVETLRLTKRRQEHLDSLGLDLVGRTVLEVGAGIGDHTTFFLDRGCRVLSTDGRPENLAVFLDRFDLSPSCRPGDRLEIGRLDLDRPPADLGRRFEVVYCYGVLYHLERPGSALDFLARCCTSLLLVETLVAPGWDEAVRPAGEDCRFVSESIHGMGCRPTRPWVFERLRQSFDFVYVPVTQPWHEQFPLDWVTPPEGADVPRRAVFVASRGPLASSLLVEVLPERQHRGRVPGPAPLHAAVAERGA